MRRTKFIVIAVFCAILSIFLFMINVFAQQIHELNKELEEPQKVPAESIIRPNVEYKAGDLRDPFQAPIAKAGGGVKGLEGEVSAAAAPPSLTVQGIIWGGRFPQAIINNKVVKVGDTIEGARIISIDKSGVTVFFQDRQYNLSPPSENTKPSEKL